MYNPFWNILLEAYMHPFETTGLGVSYDSSKEKIIVFRDSKHAKNFLDFTAVRE